MLPARPEKSLEQAEADHHDSDDNSEGGEHRVATAHGVVVFVGNSRSVCRLSTSVPTNASANSTSSG